MYLLIFVITILNEVQTTWEIPHSMKLTISKYFYETGRTKCTLPSSGVGNLLTLLNCTWFP